MPYLVFGVYRIRPNYIHLSVLVAVCPHSTSRQSHDSLNVHTVINTIYVTRSEYTQLVSMNYMLLPRYTAIRIDCIVRPKCIQYYRIKLYNAHSSDSNSKRGRKKLANHHAHLSSCVRLVGTLLEKLLAQDNILEWRKKAFRLLLTWISCMGESTPKRALLIYQGAIEYVHAWLYGIDFHRCILMPSSYMSFRKLPDSNVFVSVLCRLLTYTSDHAQHYGF